MATGIRRIHSKNCPAKAGSRCRCNAGWEASVFSKRDGKKIRKVFKREAEAKSWRADAKRSLDLGTMRAPGQQTFREAAILWIDGVESGEITGRGGRRFKPSTARGYRQVLEDSVIPELGGAKLAMISTLDLQELVDRWHSEETPPATIRNRIKPIQGIYKRARTRGGLGVNPTHDLELPSPVPQEIEIVGPEVAQRLVDALPLRDRCLWATALYAGLRCGELQALRWGAVDLAAGRIQVRESWDRVAGSIEPKTASSRRSVPLPAFLRQQLVDLRLDLGDVDSAQYVFGRQDGKPFDPATAYRRADTAWSKAGLSDRLRFHKARHTYASFMIEARVNAKALATYMGHSSIKVTFDTYGHLMPGNEAEAAGLLDAYLDRSNTASRVAQVAS